jgi:hypothetical protein
VGEWEAGHIGSEHARVELGDIQQRIEQIVHARHGGVDLRGDPAAFGLVGLGAQLRDEQVQGVHRLPQIVAGGRQEARFREIGSFQLLVEPPQLVVHPVQVRGEVAQLIPVRDFDPPGEIPRCNFVEPCLHLLDRPDHRQGNRVAEQQGQRDASDSKPDDYPLRAQVSRLARLDARHHVGFRPVDELVREQFHAIGQRTRLRRLQRPALPHLAVPDQPDDLGHYPDELVIFLVHLGKQLDFILRHELQPVEVIAELIELPYGCFERPVVGNQQR